MKKVGLKVGDMVRYIGNDERYKKWLAGTIGKVIEVPHVIIRVDFGEGFNDVPLALDSVKSASIVGKERKAEEISVKVGDKFNYDGVTWEVIQTSVTESKVKAIAAPSYLLGKETIVDNKIIERKKIGEKDISVGKIERRNPRIAAEITKVLEEITEPELPEGCNYPEIWYHARERVRESGEPVTKGEVKKVYDSLMENLSPKEAYLTPPSWVKQPEIWNNVMRMLEIKGPVDYGAAVAYYKNKCKKMNLVAGEAEKKIIVADLTNQQLRNLFNGKDRGFLEEVIVALYNKFPVTRWKIENWGKVACKKINLVAELSPRDLAKKAKVK